MLDLRVARPRPDRCRGCRKRAAAEAARLASAAGMHAVTGAVLMSPMAAGAVIAPSIEAVGLADRRVEIDRQGIGARPCAGRPGPGEEFPADPVELADVAPAEAAQERAEGRGGLDREAQDPARAAGTKGPRVINAVAARERRNDECEQHVARVRRAGLGAEIEVLLDECLQAEVVGQRGRREQARIGHQPVVVEATSIRSMLCDDRINRVLLPFGRDGVSSTPSSQFRWAPDSSFQRSFGRGSAVDPG